MPDVVFHPAAYEELHYAHSWYEGQASGLGERFLKEIEHAIDTIQQSPTTWPVYIHGTRRFLVHRFPFAIVYRHNEHVITVVVVMHLKRKPEYWQQRIQDKNSN